jgi:hypothetical protein
MLIALCIAVACVCFMFALQFIIETTNPERPAKTKSFAALCGLVLFGVCGVLIFYAGMLAGK